MPDSTTTEIIVKDEMENEDIARVMRQIEKVVKDLMARIMLDKTSCMAHPANTAILSCGVQAATAYINIEGPSKVLAGAQVPMTNVGMRGRA